MAQPLNLENIAIRSLAVAYNKLRLVRFHQLNISTQNGEETTGVKFVKSPIIDPLATVDEHTKADSDARVKMQFWDLQDEEIILNFDKLDNFGVRIPYRNPGHGEEAYYKEVAQAIGSKIAKFYEDKAVTAYNAKSATVSAEDTVTLTGTPAERAAQVDRILINHALGLQDSDLETTTWVASDVAAVLMAAPNFSATPYSGAENSLRASLISEVNPSGLTIRVHPGLTAGSIVTADVNAFGFGQRPNAKSGVSKTEQFVAYREDAGLVFKVSMDNVMDEQTDRILVTSYSVFGEVDASRVQVAKVVTTA